MMIISDCFLNAAHWGHASTEETPNYCWRHKLLHRIHFMESSCWHRGILYIKYVPCMYRDWVVVFFSDFLRPLFVLFFPYRRMEHSDFKVACPFPKLSWRSWEVRNFTNAWWRWTLKWRPCYTPMMHERLRGKRWSHSSWFWLELPELKLFTLLFNLKPPIGHNWTFINMKCFHHSNVSLRPGVLSSYGASVNVQRFHAITHNTF